MSKLSFRARALDASKPMPIYMAEELPDLPDFSAINRAVPQMPSGMQKEEECEHHLQRAICAGLIIPTPEVTDVPLKDFYDKVCPSNYKQPRQLIHMQPFTMEQDIPDYDMDSDDERWLQAQKSRLDLTPLKFEEMMDRLEKSSGQTVVTLSEAKALLKEDDELTIAVFDYWLNKRLKTQHPLILSVRTEHRSGTAANNPYLAFRRRTEKMQTRKNRKNDEVSYEKMLKLRRDLVRAVTLLELVKRREKCKREFVHLTVEVFEKRFQARDYSGAVVAEAQASKAASQPQRPAFTPIFQNHYPNQSWADAVTNQAQAAAQAVSQTAKSTYKDDVIPRREKRQYKKRKHKSVSGRGLGEGLSSEDEGSVGGAARGATPEPDEQEDDGPFAFRRNRLCNYHMPRPTLGNWPWCPKEENGTGDKRFRFTLTSLSNPKQCIGFARRRVGRGGRIILDRVTTDYDDFWRGLDFSIIESTPSPADQPAQSSSTTTTTDLPVTPVKTDPLRTNIHNKYSAVSGVASAASWDISSPNLKSQSSVSFSSASDFVRNSDNNSASNSGNVATSSSLLSLANERLTDGLPAIKVEPMDVEEGQEVKVEVKKEEDQEDMVEFLRALRRDWLHFRPKTPPPNWEPPCDLLPPDDSPFSNNTVPPFQMEVEPLDPSNSSFLLDQSPFITDLFELDKRWSEDDTTSNSSAAGPSTAVPPGPSQSQEPPNGPQESLFEESSSSSDQDYWRTVGVTRFTLRDAGGDASTSRTPGGVRDEDVWLDSFVECEKREKIKSEGCGTPSGCPGISSNQSNSMDVGSTNGLIPQIGFAADVPSTNHTKTSKHSPYAYSNTKSNAGKMNLITSAQSVTLNSHSANNLLEFPLTAAVDVELEDSAAPKEGVVSSGPAPKTPNGGVRNNKNNLVMEVT